MIQFYINPLHLKLKLILNHSGLQKPEQQDSKGVDVRMSTIIGFDHITIIRPVSDNSSIYPLYQFQRSSINDYHLILMDFV